MKFEEVVQNIIGDQNLKSELAKLGSFDEVYDFFKSNGYEGTEKELKENLFSKSSAISEEQLASVSGGANGRQALAACAGIMMMLGVAPIGLENTAVAKSESISHRPSKILPQKDNKVEIINKEIQENRDQLSKKLNDSFKGQSKEKIKKQIENFFDIYSRKKMYAAEGRRNRKLPHPEILIFDGKSQQEKEEMAKILSQALTGKDPIKISADDIEREKSSLPDYLKKNEGKIKVVMIDCLDSHPRDEMLRGILDGRWRDIRGKSIDISGLIVICMTNETKASLQGRVKLGGGEKLVELKLDKRGNVIYDEDEQPVYGAPTKEGSKAIIPHDGALFNKIAGRIYYFDED